MKFNLEQNCHTCCSNNLECKTPFEIIKRKKGEEDFNPHTEVINILFLLEGKLKLSYGKFLDQHITEGKIFILPPSTGLNITYREDSKLISCKFKIQPYSFENLRLNSLLPFIQNKEDAVFFSLDIKEQISKYLFVLEDFLESRISNTCIYHYKQQELFLLMHLLYEKEELAAFFSPIMSTDMNFKAEVLKNFRLAQNVSELANLMNYSLSGFKKKFERNFNQSVFKWMQEQRSAMILKELRENRLSNKEIIDRYDFSSEARFYEFCKRHFGKTPGEIHKKGYSDQQQEKES